MVINKLVCDFCEKEITGKLVGLNTDPVLSKTPVMRIIDLSEHTLYNRHMCIDCANAVSYRITNKSSWEA